MFLRIMAIALSVMMAVSFSGCKTNVSKNGTVISWYMPKPIDNMKDQELVEKEANKIIQEQLGVTLNFRFIDTGSYNDKMNVIISSGEAFDICFTSSWANNYLQNIKKNAFLDISDLLKEYGPDIIGKTDSRVLDALSIGNKIYAIPSQIPLSTLSSRVLKKELVDKYHFDYKNAKSLASLEPFLENIKQNEPGIIPLLVQGKSPLSDYSSDQRYNDDTVSVLRFDEKTKQYVKYFEIPEVVEKYRLLNKYYKKGYIAKDAATQKDYMAEAKSGKYAVMNSVGYYTEDGSKSSMTYGFPCVETFLNQDIITTAGVMTAMTAIGNKSENPEQAIKLLNLIWKDPVLSNTLAYGVEGIHYTVEKKAEDGTIISVQPKSGSEQTWAIWHNWLGPLWDQWDSPWNRAEALEEMKKINEEAEVSSSFGFIFNSEPVKTEIAQLTSVFNEISPIFNTGSMPDFDEYLNNANKKLETVGIDKVLAEINKQFNEWMNNK